MHTQSPFLSRQVLHHIYVTSLQKQNSVQWLTDWLIDLMASNTARDVHERQ